MPALSLPTVDAAVDRSFEFLRSQPRGHVALTGPFGAGKSTVMKRLTERLRAEGRETIRVTFLRADDASCAVVADLMDHVIGHSELAAMPVRRAPVLTQLEATLGSFSPDTVLLLDEPQSPDTWSRVPTIFDERVGDCLQRLLDWGHDKALVVSGRPGTRVLPGRVFEVGVTRAAEPREVLERAGLTSSAVQQLVGRRFEELSHCSPIEVRLAGLLAETGVASVQRSPLTLQLLLEMASGQVVTPALRRALARLALVREPLTEALVAWGTEALTDDERSRLSSVFLFGDEGERRLHESIAIQASTHHWLTGHEREDAHRQLARYYRAAINYAFADASVLAPIVRAEVECVHHRTYGADPQLLNDELFFVEQYDALGRFFGVRGKQLWMAGRVAEAKDALQTAVGAYDRAITYAPDDWYALHYRAFNRDALGGDVNLIEPDYLRVHELRPSFVWGHSRYVRWLITCGRLREARTAFAFAQRGLEAQQRLFEDLHIDVARQSLENGHHAFALEVLLQVPGEFREALTRFDELLEWARYQAEIENGETVFPPAIALGQRWARSQFAAPSERVERFWPGVVTAQAGDRWRFRVAFAPHDFGWREVDRDELVRLGADPALRPLAVGRFVEFLTANGVERLEFHPLSGNDPFARLRVRFPDPRRYLA